MNYSKEFAERISKLRIEKGVSARDMSMTLGQSESYINKIENGRTMPSMEGFFNICDYFEISPAEFFDYKVASPTKTREIAMAAGKLTPLKAEHILNIINDLNSK